MGNWYDDTPYPGPVEYTTADALESLNGAMAQIGVTFHEAAESIARTAFKPLGDSFRRVYALLEPMMQAYCEAHAEAMRTPFVPSPQFEQRGRLDYRVPKINTARLGRTPRFRRHR